MTGSSALGTAIALEHAPLRLVERLPYSRQPVGAPDGMHVGPPSDHPYTATWLSALTWWPSWVSWAAIESAREMVATAAAVFSTPLDLVCGTAPGPGKHRAHAPPVVLVHGFAASQACWFPLRRALHGRTVVSFNYWPWASSMDELADQLTDTVEDLLAITGTGKVHLIGHSLGGVIIAHALVRNRLARHVDLVITLGSPFGGSPLAGLLPIGPLIWALRPGSALLRRLAAAPPPAGVRWLTFGSTLDPIVPGNRAVPANRQVMSVSIDTAGHSGMLRDPDVIARIVAAINTPDAAADPGDLLAA